MKNRQMQPVSWCREQGGADVHSLRELKRAQPDQNQAILLDYLRSGDMHDDIYEWDQSLIRAVEEFNIILPSDFYHHILDHHKSRLKKMILFRMIQKISFDISLSIGKQFHIEYDDSRNLTFRNDLSSGTQSLNIGMGCWNNAPFTDALAPVRELFLYGSTPAEMPREDYWKLSFFTKSGLASTVAGSLQRDTWEKSCMIKLWEWLEDQTGMDLGAKYICLMEEPKPAAAPKNTPSVISEEFIAFIEKVAGCILSRISSGNNNSMISPLSIAMILAVIASAASGKSRQEIEQFIDIPSEDFRQMASQAFKAFSDPSAAASMANGIYISNDIAEAVKPDFLARLRNELAADEIIDAASVAAINRWVDEKTRHMIPTLIRNKQQLGDIALLNAVTFEDQWRNPYDPWEVSDGVFHAACGLDENAVMLHSTEYLFIINSKLSGFVKPYRHGGFAFVGLLPDETVQLQELLDLSPAQCCASARNAIVDVTMPEFKFDFSASIKDAVTSLGISSVFSQERADLSNMLTVPHSYFSDVIHKTYIEVDRRGTKAAAVTCGIAAAGCAPPPEQFKVVLDRPFVFAIVHMPSGLTMFQGIVRTISS